MPGMLEHLRVLDLTDDRGNFAGAMLAQLGADVTLVEPPGGHRHRHQGPFFGDQPHPDNSLTFWAHNRGKSSIVITDPGELYELASGVDVVIESGVFDIDLKEMRSRYPHLVTAAISAFGQTGPKADWAASDLTIAAASGTMSITGDRDRPPVRISLPQTWHNAAADAVGGILIALWERRQSGLGQHIDASAQESFADCTQFQMMSALVGADIPNRLPGAVQLGDFLIPWVYECADGFVTITVLFGPMIGPFTSRLMKWIAAEGFCDAELAAKDWVDFGLAVFDGRESIESFDQAVEAVRNFSLSKTKDELLARALADHLLIAPITTTADVLALEQLQVRDYWEDATVKIGAPVDAADAGGLTASPEVTVRFPGALAKTSGPGLVNLSTPPQLGAHNITAREKLNAPRIPGPGIRTAEFGAAAVGSRPLEGVKVLDFMWAMAGPGATRTLADYGATVVKVESESKPDVLRGVNPFVGEEGGQENALQFHSLNANKLGVTLDLSTSAARDVVVDLVRWCDVLTESFSPRAMASWGLGYEDLKAINPDLIMFSSCLMGQTGPMRNYAGFGTMAAAIAGFYPITGWPDRIPAGPFTAYTDYISPRTSVALIMAALEHRERTGNGQRIDFSQLEGALHYLGPILLDKTVNHRTAGRHGNADPHRCPHGVYPAQGDDRWVAIAVESDAQWNALAKLIGAEHLGELNVDGRRQQVDEIDGLITAWTADRLPEEAQYELQAVNVAAHMVNNAADLVVDPQMVARNRFIKTSHPLHDHTWVEGSNFTLSRTPGAVEWGGPMFGQHNMEVLEGLLGYDGDRIAELVIAGAIS